MEKLDRSIFRFARPRWLAAAALTLGVAAAAFVWARADAPRAQRVAAATSEARRVTRADRAQARGTDRRERPAVDMDVSDGASAAGSSGAGLSPASVGGASIGAAVSGGLPSVPLGPTKSRQPVGSAAEH